MVKMEPHYFIAIRIPKEIKKRLSLIKHETNLMFDRFVHEEDVHLTLVFLGKCTDEKRTQVVNSLRRLVSSFEPFRLQLSTFGTFGHKEKPRVFWIGVEEEPILYSYQHDIYHEMKTLGFPLETRPFTPHITLARKWIGDRSYKPIKTDVTGLHWEVEDIVLYKSNVTSTPKYEIEELFHFRSEKV